METIKLDLIPGKKMPSLHASQYDDGRDYHIDLTENRVPYVLDGTETISLTVRKCDNTLVTMDIANTFAGKSYIEFRTTEQMNACAGFNYGEITLEKNGTQISSLNFYLQVEGAPDEGGIPSQSEINNLNRQIDDHIDDVLPDMVDDIAPEVVREVAPDIVAGLVPSEVASVAPSVVAELVPTEVASVAPSIVGELVPAEVAEVAPAVVREVAEPIVEELVPIAVGNNYYNKTQTDELVDDVSAKLSSIEDTTVVMPINLFNENDPDFSVDTKLAASSGVPVSAANSFSTGFIPVVEGKTYNWIYGAYLSTSQVMTRLCAYGSDKAYKSTYTQDAGRGFSVPVGSEIAYVRFSGNKSHIPPTEQNVMFTIGFPDRYYPYHEPYNDYSVKMSALDTDYIMGLGGEIEKIYPKWELGSFDSSWRYVDSTDTIRSDYIPVADRLKITVPNGYLAKIYPFSLSGERLELYPYSCTDEITIKAETASFIKISFSKSTPETVIDANTYGLDVDVVRYGSDKSFKTEMTANPNVQTVDPSQVLPQYLSLVAVKEKHESGKIDVTVGYLYRTVLAPYKFYYAQGKPENIKYLCDWDTALAGASHNTPIWYCFGMTDEGDIICVHRGEIESADRARDYPIVYPHTDYNNPVKVMLSGEKPTSWISNNGDYAESGHFWFGEYIRNVHTHAYVWEVTAPYTNVADWNIVKTYERDIDPTDPSSMVLGKIEHIHHVSRDPFSGVLYVTTGDHWTEARIDYLANGTWGILAEGDEEICRQLNFIYTPTYVYWASDAFSKWNPDTQEYVGGTHKFFRATRDASGLIDINSIERFDIPYIMASVATYHVAYIAEPECILVLDRIDRAFSYAELPFHVWNIKEEKFELSGVAKQARGSIDQYLGFRCECCQHYPNLYDSKISVGFSLYPNSIAVCGNPNPNIIPAQGGNTSDDSVNAKQVNSMTIEVERNNG